MTASKIEIKERKLVVGGVKTLLLSTSGEDAANVYWPWIDLPEVIDRVAAFLSR